MIAKSTQFSPLLRWLWPLFTKPATIPDVPLCFEQTGGLVPRPEIGMTGRIDCSKRGGAIKVKIKLLILSPLLRWV